MKTKIKHCWLLCLLAFCSCSSWIDIKPSDRLSEGMLFEDRQGFEKAINGVYVGLTDRALYGTGRKTRQAGQPGTGCPPAGKLSVDSRREKTGGGGDA